MGAYLIVRTTRITIETESLLVVHKAKTFVAWCPVCCADVEVMLLEAGSLGEDIPSSYLDDWLRTGKLHLWHPPEGTAQMCLPSLLRCFESESVPRLQPPLQTPQTRGDER
jgi:hypothetical protein